MEETTMKICPDSFNGKSKFSQQIIKFLSSEVFDCSFKSQIEERYAEIQKEECESRESFCKEYTSFKLAPCWNDYKNGKNLGSDLPVWFCPEKKTLAGIDRRKIPELKNVNKKTIFLFGIDPLRRNQEEGKLTLGTPWGLHSKKYREGGTVGTSRGTQARYIRYVIETLLANGASVYVTDLFKIYCDNPKRRNNQSISSCFKKEIEIVNPDLVCSVGISNKKYVKEYFPDLTVFPESKVLYLHHPNGVRKISPFKDKYEFYENELKSVFSDEKK